MQFIDHAAGEISALLLIITFFLAFFSGRLYERKNPEAKVWKIMTLGSLSFAAGLMSIAVFTGDYHEKPDYSAAKQAFEIMGQIDREEWKHPPHENP
jgi:hypothetical protein